MAGLATVRKLRSGADAAEGAVSHPRRDAGQSIALLQCLAMLDAVSVARAAQVCKAWAAVAARKELWHCLFARSFSKSHKTGFSAEHAEAHDWRTLFVLSFNGLRAGFRLPPLGTDLPLAEGKVDSDAPEGLVETLVPRAEEWIHVLICAKEQQAHRTVIPRGTPTHRAPLAEIDYWDTQLATLQSLSGQIADPSIARVRDILCHAGHKVGDDLARQMRDCVRLTTEASWNAKYFGILRAPFTKIAEGDVDSVRDDASCCADHDAHTTLQLAVVAAGVVRTLHSVWSSSRFYNTRRRMEPLLGRVGAALAARVAQSVDLSRILREAAEASAAARDELEVLLDDRAAMLRAWLSAFLGLCGSRGAAVLRELDTSDRPALGGANLRSGSGPKLPPAHRHSRKADAVRGDSGDIDSVGIGGAGGGSVGGGDDGASAEEGGAPRRVGSWSLRRGSSERVIGMGLRERPSTAAGSRSDGRAVAPDEEGWETYDLGRIIDPVHFAWLRVREVRDLVASVGQLASRVRRMVERAASPLPLPVAEARRRVEALVTRIEVDTAAASPTPPTAVRRATDVVSPLRARSIKSRAGGGGGASSPPPPPAEPVLDVFEPACLMRWQRLRESVTAAVAAVSESLAKLDDEADA